MWHRVSKLDPFPGADAPCSLSACLQVAKSSMYDDKLIIILSNDHFVLVSKKTGPVGKAFDLMIQGTDDTNKAYINARVSGR